MKTVQELTGLKIDHFVNVDFDAFRAVTTALGGVYVDVDRRYYYGGPDFERVDVQPGYQRLAGDQALQYVRFRHDDNNDYGRIDRQQHFLRAAKEQALNWSLATKIPSVVSLLAENVTSDLSTMDAIKLSWWGVKLGMGRVKQVNLADQRPVHRRRGLHARDARGRADRGGRSAGAPGRAAERRQRAVDHDDRDRAPHRRLDEHHDRAAVGRAAQPRRALAWT